MSDQSETLQGYSALDVETVAAGDTIFLAGTHGRHMYVVLEGHVEISIGGRVVDRIGRGGFFGEMSLIDGGQRTGDATATADSKLLRLGEQQFLKLVHEVPIFSLKVLRTVVHRLRRANAAAAAAEKAAAAAIDQHTDDELVPLGPIVTPPPLPATPPAPRQKS
jgi:CRP-like cAMP-binding protein